MSGEDTQPQGVDGPRLPSGEADRGWLQTEGLFAKVFKASPVGINIFRVGDGRSLIANEAFAVLVGYAREEIERHTAEELRLFADPGVRERWMDTLRAGGEVYSQSARIRRKSGEIRDALASLQPIELDGEPAILVIATDITERTRADENLRRSEEKFKHVFETANVGKSLTLPNGSVNVNKALADMLGYSTEELAGKTWQDVTPAGDIAATEAVLAPLLSGDEDAARFSKRYVRKDGTMVWADVSTTLSRDDSGAPEYFITTVVDITDRVRSEAELRAVEERFERAFRAGPAGMTITTIADGRFVDANDAFLEMFEFAREEVVGRTSTELRMWMPEERDRLIRAQLATGGLRGAELAARSKSGRQITILFSSTPLEINGRPCLVTTMVDITESARARERIGLLAEALRASANAVQISDRTGAIVWVNPAFSRITGYESEEVVGRNPRELVRSGHHDSAFYEDLWRTILRGEVWEGEVTNRRKDGALYPERQTVTPVRSADGEIAHFIAIKQDVTAEKRLQEQYLASQKMESVGRLAGGIAHDFNNLLTVITGTVDLAMANVPPGSPLREDLLQIQGAGNRAAALTRQLLAFARRQIVEPRVVSPNDSIEGMADMLQRLIGEHIDLIVRTAEPVGNVRIDPGQLEQVLLNLVVNARDAMPEGGSLTIQTRNSGPGEGGPGGGSAVVLVVSDTGCGMDEATRSRIFEAFFTTKEIGRGTGLGLATVQGIVEAAGGAISVETEPDRGTTFTVFLPRVWETAEKPEVVREVEAGPCTETILVVEDDPALGLVAQRILESIGYTVLRVAGGQEALKLLETRDDHVHLMLTDVVMPGLSGPQLAARVAELRPGMPVLFASGYTEDVLPRDGGTGGAARHFLAKPYTRADLQRKVRQMLDADNLPA